LLLLEVGVVGAQKIQQVVMEVVAAVLAAIVSSPHNLLM